MNDETIRTAFDSTAPAAERRDALAQVQREHLPSASDLIPRGAVAEVIDYIQGQYDEGDARLAKAQVIPFPGRPRGKDGMQSVRLDRLQVMAYGDYFERPSSLGFEALRHMVEQTPVLNAVIMTRIRQVQRFCNVQDGGSGPGFQIAHVDPDHKIDADEQRSRNLLARFLTHCGWEFNPRRRKRLNRDNFSTFMAKLVRESLTYDASAIETEQRQDGRGIAGLYAVDGSTIRLCAEEGYRGDDQVVAVQVATGQIVTAYTVDDLIYEPRNPRADVRLAGYGLGETELLVRVVTGFLNAMTHNTKGFDSNAIPRGILHLTGEYGETELAAFRRYWNGMVRGVNNTWALPVLNARTPESKATFERLGVDYDEMHFSKWMTFLVSIICAIYGMSPAEINFDSFTAGNTSALAGSDTAEKLAASKDSGLRPLMTYFESILSDYVIADFAEKYCFRWTGLDEEDPVRRDELRKLVLTVNELRSQEGFDALPGPLGEAPINPSLVGPWMQLQGQGGDAHADDEEPGGEGDADGGDDGEPARRPPARDQEDAQARAADGDAEDAGDEWGRLAKANAHHGDDGQFTFGVGERPGLFAKPPMRVTMSRNQVRPGERLSEAGARARRELLASFAAAGGAIKNRDSRHPISITATSGGHMLHLGDKHQPLTAHIEAAFCASDLLRRAVLAERHRDRKDNNPNLYVARYFAPFAHGGILYRCKLTVFEHRAPGGGFKLYDHALSELELDEVEKKSPARGGASRGPEYMEGLEGPPPSAFGGALVSISPGLKISVRHLLQGVNRDGDGLPFGTTAESLAKARRMPDQWGAMLGADTSAVWEIEA